MKKVSIIIPAFNAEKYLKKSISSVLNQTYDNTEIILIDDGSTDSTLKILKQYEKASKKIKVIHQENKGVGETKNIGIKNATGDYITFVDADDYIKDTTIDELMHSIDNKTDAVIYGIKIVNGNKSRSIIPKYNPWAELKYNMSGGKMYKLSYLKKNKILYPKTKLYDDVCFTLNVFSHTNNILMIEKALYVNVMNPDSVTASAKKNNIRSTYETINYIFDNVNIKKYNKKMFSFFLMKLIIFNIILQIDNDELKKIYDLYQKDYNFLKSKYKVYFYWNKYETFSINFIINIFVLFTKIGLYKFPIFMLKKFKIRIR